MVKRVRTPLSSALVLVMLLTVIGILPAAASHEGDGAQHDFATSHFEERWERTDKPVSDTTVSRTWMWGPGPYTDGMLEEYAEASGDLRQVQYFDKSRMEINHDPAIGPDNVWYVTNGLLVVEMVSGWYQIGDETFDLSPEPSQERIAGDPNAPNGVSYADIDALGLREMPALLPGTTITRTITEEGTIIGEPSYAQYGVTAAYRVTEPDLDHTVASVFWNFMTSSGVVWEDGGLTNDNLFLNPFYATGFPITEAYWAEFTVAGIVQPVLWQCFERRCLTYTPGNDSGWEVEAGNVGQHYFRWRYGDDGPEMEQATIYLVNTGIAALNQPVGCDDVLIPVVVDVPKRDTAAGRVTVALNRLFTYDHPTLHNAFENANLSVQSVSITGASVTVNLTGTLNLGGVCDEPRATEQIRSTVQGITGINQITITRNGGPFIPPGGSLEGGVLASFDVNGQVFKVFVTNPETVAAILALHGGDTSIGNIPNGLIHRGPGIGNHNAPYSWHLDPDEIVMSQATIELCDGTPSYVESNVDEYVDNVQRYCPWQAQLVAVEDYR